MVVVVVHVVWICFDLLKQQWWVDVAAVVGVVGVVGVVAWVCRIVSTIVVLLLPHPTNSHRFVVL